MEQSARRQGSIRAGIMVPFLLTLIFAIFQVNCSAPTSTQPITALCPAMGPNDTSGAITSFLDLVDNCSGNQNIVGVPFTLSAPGTIEQINLFYGDSSALTAYSAPNTVELAVYSVSGSTATYVPFSYVAAKPITKPMTVAWNGFPEDYLQLTAGSYLVVAHYGSPSANASTLIVGLKPTGTCSDYTTCYASSIHNSFSPWNLSGATPYTSCPEVNLNICQ